MSEVLDVPAHVPPHLVRDVDLYNIAGAHEDVQLAWKKLQDESPDIFYTPRYGGYWVLTRAELLDQVWPDHERFSSAGGIAIPRMPEFPPQLPIEVDPPAHRFYRVPINMAVSPKALQSLSERARTLAIELIEKLQPQGHCEFVKDFAAHLPMTVFLSMMGLPLTDREWLISRAEVMTRSPDHQERMTVVHEIFGYLGGWVQKRAAEPGDDLISQILKIKVGDRAITPQEVLSECSLVLFGGLDTVAGTMAFFARYLATHPEHLQELVENPGLIPKAVDELIRRHPLPTVGRKLTQDVTLAGVTMKEGDYVMLSTLLHGLDERAWPNALQVDFHRDTHDIMSFGRGNHKCPGANLARAELRIFLEEWLKRIPKFSIPEGAHSPTLSGGVAGVLALPLVWSV